MLKKIDEILGDPRGCQHGETCLHNMTFDDYGTLGENINNPSSGPVAQLGARFHGMEEVVGSIPTRSTNIPFNTNRL